MNILLTNAYSRHNGGDAGIIAAQLQQIQRVAPGSVVTIASMEAEEEPFEGAAVMRSFFYYAIYQNSSAIGRFVNSIIVVASTLVWAVIYRYTYRDVVGILPRRLRKLAYAYATTDRIITAGGGYLVGGHGLRSLMSIGLHLHAIAIALILRKPVLLHAQSFGPFPNIIERWLMRLVLNCDLTIFVREEISSSILRNTGIAKANILLVPDAAFMLNRPEVEAVQDIQNKLSQAGIDTTKPLIGITVANRFQGEVQGAYETAIIEFVRQLAKRDVSILLIPQVTDPLHNDDDRLVQNRIMNRLGDYKNVHDLRNQFSYQDLLGLYSLCGILIGTRMHSVVFAYVVNTPTLAIAYEHKTQGIMAELGLSEWVLEGGKFKSSELVSKFHDLEGHHNVSVQSNSVAANIKHQVNASEQVINAFLK